MEKKNCEFCDKIFIKSCKKQRFCCKKCQQSCWIYKNKKRFNALMNNQYYKHKDKWKSRLYTKKLYLEIGKRKCKNCGCDNSQIIEIHHETYPTEYKEIKKAIAEGKIYYLCKNCHKK